MLYKRFKLLLSGYYVITLYYVIWDFELHFWNLRAKFDTKGLQISKDDRIRNSNQLRNTAFSLPFSYPSIFYHSIQVKIKTYPANGRLAWTEAFKGKDSTEERAGRNIFASRTLGVTNTYKSPLVAVQFDFTDPGAKNTDALFHCFMFDRNMEIETRKHASGMVKLAARVNK